MRKPRPGFNYSIESIFENLRQNLKDKVNFSVAVSSLFNDGWFSKLQNIREAASRQKKDAVAHITGEVYFLCLLMRKKNVLLTIHDCRFIERKKGIEKKIIQWLYLKAPVKKAAHVTTVSEATKADVMRYTGCTSSKITVIPVAVDAIFKASPKPFNAACPVILQVGAASNKNLSNLIEAIKQLPCKLVIAGQPSVEDLNKLREYGIDHSIKFNLSKEQLYREYVDCDIVAFASTFEGFGMPIVEANSVERAVLTSNISSMPEVAGNAACLVNPFDVVDMRNGLKRIIEDDTYREQLIANGQQNKLRFSPQRIAEEYYAIYEKMASDMM